MPICICIHIDMFSLMCIYIIAPKYMHPGTEGFIVSYNCIFQLKLCCLNSPVGQML